jgi:hypothetical protein
MVVATSKAKLASSCSAAAELACKCVQRSRVICSYRKLQQRKHIEYDYGTRRRSEEGGLSVQRLINENDSLC